MSLETISTSVIPYVLENLGNKKATKYISRAIAAGILINNIYSFFKNKTVKTKYTVIKIPNNCEWFEYIHRWLSKTKVDYTGSEFEFVAFGTIPNPNSVKPVEDISQKNVKKSFTFVPSYKCSTQINNIPVLVELKLGKKDKDNPFQKDEFLISIQSKNKADLDAIFEHIEKEGHIEYEHPKTNIYTRHWSSWSRTKSIYKVKDVVLPNGEFEKLHKIIGNFLNSRDSYYDRGLNWRLGILLSGLSGAGKSSTVQAIATHFNLDVYILQLSEMDDTKLLECINGLPERCILLLEDLRKETLKKGDTMIKNSLTSSGLLNALDGISIPEGRICFMTTNFEEELDSIMLRPGRVDHTFRFTYANSEQIYDLAKKFDISLPENTIKEWEKEQISMAEVQNRFLKIAKLI